MSHQHATPTNKRQSVVINGKTFNVPNIYPCFYPDRNVCWEPEPSPSHHNYTEQYFEWGRRHYGDDWYQQRRQMLDERNIYVHRDNTYLKRQWELRELENAVDGRVINGWKMGAAWKSIWSRVGAANSPESPPEDADSDPDSPYMQALEQLEENKQALGWTEEEYQFNFYRMETGLAANKRSWHENEIGNQLVRLEIQRLKEEEEKLNASTLPRKSVAYSRLFEAYERLSDRLHDLRCGKPKEIADGDYNRGNVMAKKREDKQDKLLKNRPRDETELMKKLEHWQKYGLTVAEHDRLTMLHGFEPIQRPNYSSEDCKFCGYDYLSLCKRTPKTRPPPTASEFESLAKTWADGLILNGKEIEELGSMYGYSSDIKADSTPPKPPPLSPRMTRSRRSSSRRAKGVKPSPSETPQHPGNYTSSRLPTSESPGTGDKRSRKSSPRRPRSRRAKGVRRSPSQTPQRPDNYTSSPLSTPESPEIDETRSRKSSVSERRLLPRFRSYPSCGQANPSSEHPHDPCSRSIC